MVLEKVILTGATGMFGKHMSASLKSIGTEIIPVTRTKNEGCIDWNLENWLSIKEMDQKFGNTCAIIHAAAMLPNDNNEKINSYIYDVNVRSCINIAEWALLRSVPIIYISSGSVYLNPHDNFIKENDILGINDLGKIYGMTKILAENVFNLYKSKGLRVSILRPSSLYGHGMKNNNLVSKFLNLAKNGETIEIYKPFNDSIDFLHASDLSYAVLKVLKKNVGKLFNISSGSLCTIKELAESCLEVTKNGKIKFLDTDDKYIKQTSSTFSLDNHKAKLKLGWNSKIDIKKGLRLLYLNSIE